VNVFADGVGLRVEPIAGIAKLKKTVANKDKELNRLCSDVPALVRVIDQITAETPNHARRSKCRQPTSFGPSRWISRPGPVSSGRLCRGRASAASAAG
jgi:hypothetical protein